MVTKQTVEETIVSEITNAVSNSANSGEINGVFIQGDEHEEDVPEVVYMTTEDKQNYNNAAKALYGKIIDDDTGNVLKHVYREYVVLTFDIQVKDPDQSVSNEIYETIRKYFLQYEKRIKEPTNLDSEINDINVRTADGSADTGLEPTHRFENIPVEVEFYRKVTESNEPIETVNHVANTVDQDIQDIEFITTEVQ